MEKQTLVNYLDKLTDKRRREGTRHNQSFVLLLVLMATMSGQYGYRGIERFIKKNAEDILKYLKPHKDRLPTYATIFRVVNNIDFDEFAQIFKEWSKVYAKPQSGEIISIDGKALKGTLVEYNSKYQNFISIVSAHSQSSKMSLSISKYENKKSSEISVVEEMIRDLELTGVVFTMDALHCQKNSKNNC